MKKIFVLFCMLIILVCIFALNVSAYEQFTDVETVEGIELSSKMGDDIVTEKSAQARVKLKCTCEKGSHTFPSYYLMENVNGGNENGAILGYTVFADLNEKGASCGNKSFGMGDILAYELPDGVTNVKSTIYSSDESFEKNITFIDYSTATTLKSMTVVSGRNWYNSSLSLEEIRFPASLENISGYSFYGCTNLTTVIIPKDSKIKTIGEYAFRNCSNLEGVYLPSGIESICGDGAGAFQYCSKLWLKNTPDETEKPSIYYLPETLNRLDKVVFQGCSAMNDTVVFPSQITKYKGWEFQGSGIENYVFKGFMTQADYVGNLTYYFVNPQNTDINGVTSVCGWGNYTLTKIFCHAEGNQTHLTEKTVNENATCTKNASMVSYCFCEAEISREDVLNSALGHNNDLNNGAKLVAISYNKENVVNYMSVGYKTITCARCNENNNDVEAEPLFVFNGVSVNNNETAICIGFTINNDAIAEFNKANNISLEFGAVACYAGENGEITRPLSISDNVVTAQNKTVMAEITGNNYSSFDFKLSGFSEDVNDEYKSFGFIFGGYIYDGTNIYYLGSQCTMDAKPIIFNQILSQSK